MSNLFQKLSDADLLEVPSVDSSDNEYNSDVTGNKSDTVAGDSIVSLSKLLVAALGIVDGDTSKIDDLATDGLAGVHNSLAFRVEEIEKHFHNNEYWLGAATSPSGETHIADEIGPSVNPFQLTAGNNAWGSWVQVLGSSDTPIKPGNLKIDAHDVLVTTTNNTNTFVIMFSIGESADLTTNVTNKDYTTIAYIAATNNNDSGVEGIIAKRIDVGDKVWARCICPGQNAPNISFYVGVHEYIG